MQYRPPLGPIQICLDEQGQIPPPPLRFLLDLLPEAGDRISVAGRPIGSADTKLSEIYLVAIQKVTPAFTTFTQSPFRSLTSSWSPRRNRLTTAEDVEGSDRPFSVFAETYTVSFEVGSGWVNRDIEL
jgi:hypothetical protein